MIICKTRLAQNGCQFPSRVKIVFVVAYNQLSGVLSSGTTYSNSKHCLI